MDFFTNLSIRNKVLAAFSVIMILTVALGLFAITRVIVLNAHATDIAANAAADQPLGVVSRDAHELARLAAERHILATLPPAQAQSLPPDALPALDAAQVAVTQDFAAQWKAYQPTMDPGRETDDGNAFNAAYGQLAAAAGAMAAADNQGDHARAFGILRGGLASALTAFDTAVNDDVAYQAGQATSLTANAARTSRQGIIWISVSLALIAAATLGIGWLIVSGIATPISQMTEAMRRLARQDMGAKIPGIGRGDELGAMAAAVQVFKENGEERLKLETEAALFQKQLDQKLTDMEAAFEAAGHDQKAVVDGLALALAALAKGDLTARLSQEVAAAYQALKTDFNAAMETLQTTMRAIAGSTQNVRAGAGEITSASDDLARRTEQQAASLEQTAAALDEITATVRKTAEGAGEARLLATQSKTDAEHSGTVVSETVQAMASIDHSSREISNIIGVIDEIAFQTNLLALNAGVEAARAGDAGRGFAVVATEVRALAQRSADAAKEIKTLISTSRTQVESGVKLVGDTGTALGRIVGQVSKLNELIAGIAGSATEQATALHEVNSAVNQMDQVTQQNAAMVEQSTAASHALEGEAAELARLIGQFGTGAADADPAPARAAPHRAAQSRPRIPAHTPAPPRPSPPRPAAALAAQEDWDEF